MAKKLKLPEIYFNLGSGSHVFEITPGQYAELSERAIDHQMRLQKVEGLDAKDDSTGMTKSQRLMAQAITRNSVHYAGALAGYPTGRHDLPGGKRILVTESVTAIEAGKSCKIPRFEKFLDELLGTQAIYYMLWLKVALASLKRRDFMPGQLMGIVGEPGSGKGFLTWLTKMLLGGRSADPYLYMTGGTPFNHDLAMAEFWGMGDKQAKYDIRSRRAFGASVKSMCVDSELFIHPKGRTAFTADTFRRLMLTANPEREHVQVFPPVDNDTGEKMMLLKCDRAQLSSDKLKNQKEFISEMPSFVRFLENESIPAQLRDSRYGVKKFHHPELIELLDVMTPERQLIEILDETLWQNQGKDDLNDWRGSAEELKQILITGKCSSTAHSLLGNWPSAMGTYLDRLSRKFPERFSRTVCKGKTKWIIRTDSDVENNNNNNERKKSA